MTTYSELGYLTAFDGLTLIDHSTKTGRTPLSNAATVNLPIYVLPNGTKAYYNGTTDATLTPGRMTQGLLCTASGRTFYNQIVAKLGNYGVLTLTKANGGTATANAILLAVIDVTPGLAVRDYIWIDATFEVLDNW